jgi:hypothetical protein
VGAAVNSRLLGRRAETLRQPIACSSGGPRSQCPAPLFSAGRPRLGLGKCGSRIKVASIAGRAHEGHLDASSQLADCGGRSSICSSRLARGLGPALRRRRILCPDALRWPRRRVSPPCATYSGAVAAPTRARVLEHERPASKTRLALQQRHEAVVVMNASHGSSSAMDILAALRGVSSR